MDAQGRNEICHKIGREVIDIIKHRLLNIITYVEEPGYSGIDTNYWLTISIKNDDVYIKYTWTKGTILLQHSHYSDFSSIPELQLYCYNLVDEDAIDKLIKQVRLIFPIRRP